MAEPEADTSRRFIVEAINPSTGRKELEVLFPSHRLQWAKRMGRGAILEVGESVKDVLERPTAIYRGIIRDDDDDRSKQTEGWLAFVGKPAVRYELATGKALTPGNRLLLVFVNDERVYYNHRWEEEDALSPGSLADLEDRFREQVL